MTDDGWAQFARALTTELARLPENAIIVLHERGKPWHLAQFVQRAGDPAGGDRRIGYLRAEVGGDTVDAEGTTRPSARSTRMLEALGWHPADPDDTNWWQELTWPATTAEYDRLVDAVVTVLRDLNEVDRPADLVYRSWEPSGLDRTLHLPGVAPKDGDPDPA
ncbi:hypothetical protein Drose_12145 [Dactylosporangium roseum]|uniref:TY-Chap N-terminal domain-containing protein n=1 Tax=Dactylosporangium roseum TaxID=47989 RepID=A0ABY5Z9X9_9ACTN|nr:hypothetical protein [Dactylosporangium roseum]UWZ38900.1 hypothetical protein Drose_12145 [Dactylosporangium roseum]